MTTTDTTDTAAFTRADIAAITTTADKATIVPIAMKLEWPFNMNVLEDWAAGEDMEPWQKLLGEILADVGE